MFKILSKNSQPFVKKCQKTIGRIFLDSHCSFYGISYVISSNCYVCMFCVVGCSAGTTPVTSTPAIFVVRTSTPDTSSSDVVTCTVSTSSAASQQPSITVSTPTQQAQPVVMTTEQLAKNGNGASDAGIMSKLSGLLSLLPTQPASQPVVSALQPSTVVPSSSPSPPTVTPPAVLTAVPVSAAESPTPAKEKPEEKMEDAAPPQQPPRVVDPIAMLNQMLSQSRPATTTSSSSVNFLQSLTMLTKTVTTAGETEGTGSGEDVYMDSYGKPDDPDSFTTTWSDRSRSDADTGPPVKPLDRETTQTTVSIPIPLATQSMGPPSLQSIYGTAGISDVTSCGFNMPASVSSPVNTSAMTGDHVLSPQDGNKQCPAPPDSLNPASDGGLSPRKFAFGSDSTLETPFRLPGLDIDMPQDSGQLSAPLLENSLPVPFTFRSTDTTPPQNVPPADEFTERLRRKTSMRVSDGMASPLFPENLVATPGQTRDRMFDDGGRQPPPFEPPPNNFPAPPPGVPVYHEQPGVNPEFDRYGGARFDQWEMGDHNHELPVSSGRPDDPTHQNQFPPRPAEPAPMFPRPDFYSEPRMRMPTEDSRPRFRPMSRLPPPAAFSALRSPPPPPPERFQRPFFARF